MWAQYKSKTGDHEESLVYLVTIRALQDSVPSGFSDDGEDSKAAHEALVAHRRKLSELRSLLALDESRRSIPVGEGLQALYSHTETAVCLRPPLTSHQGQL